jgi:hypothetical protein
LCLKLCAGHGFPPSQKCPLPKETPDRRSLIAVRRSLFADRRSLFAARRSLFAARRSLFAARRIYPGVKK